MIKTTLLLLACGFCLYPNPTIAGDPGQQRVVDLLGTKNTRDIGGYLTDDGRSIRWGQIFRSDNLSRLSNDDFQRLESIGLKTVVDLRTPAEVKGAPTIWQGGNAPQVFNYPIGNDDGEWFRDQGRLLRSGRFTYNQMTQHFVDGYRSIPAAGLESYRKVLALVLDTSNWPILIHCSAGKDRSGVAVALILEILGVNREVIMEDYLLTNQVARTQEQANLLAKQHASQSTSTGSRLKTRKPPSAEAYFPMVGVMPEMLNGFYESVDSGYGSMDGYLEQLGIDQHKRQALISSLTESPKYLH